MPAELSSPARVSELAPELRDLVASAIRARTRAHAPYSDFPVGAAIRTRAGDMYVGCNVENSSFGATMCAERIAIFSAMAAGERDFAAIALVADVADPLKPCGMCRQVLAELAPGLLVLMANLTGDVITTTIGELLPATFVLPARASRP